MKFNICIWDAKGLGINTVKSFLNLNRVQIVAEVNNIQSHCYVEVSKIGTVPNVDYYLIFIENCQSQIERVFNLLELDTKKILFFNLADYGVTLYSLYENADSYLIFDKKVTRYFDIFNQRLTNKYLTCTVGDLSYIGDVCDNTIMLYMYVAERNWADTAIYQFYSLAQKFFVIENDKEGIFCDIGANIGTTCIYFKKKIDASVKILAFEPSKENFKMLKTNLLLNDINESEVTLVPMGVSDIHSQYLISYIPANPGATFLHEAGDSDSEKNPVATAIPFDDYVEENNIDINQIKYIWVDTEGFEGVFLNGARKTLQQIDVPIVLEFTPDSLRRNHTEDKFLDTVKDLYVSYIIMGDETETIHPVSELEDYFTTDHSGQGVQLDIFMLKRTDNIM